MIAAALARTGARAAGDVARLDRRPGLRQQRRGAGAPRPRRRLDGSRRPRANGTAVQICAPRIAHHADFADQMYPDRIPTGSTTRRSRRAVLSSRNARPIDDRVDRARGARIGRRRRAARGRCRGVGGRSLGPRCRRHAAAKCSAAPPRCCARASASSPRSSRLETGKPWKNAAAEVVLVRRPRRLHGKRRQPLLRQDDDQSGPESRGPNAARADRRVRRDHAVQQPARRHRLEGLSGAALRQRRRRRSRTS